MAERIVIFRTHHIVTSPADRIFCEGKTYDAAEVKEIGRRRGLQLGAVAR